MVFNSDCSPNAEMASSADADIDPACCVPFGLYRRPSGLPFETKVRASSCPDSVEIVDQQRPPLIAGQATVYQGDQAGRSSQC